MESINEILRWLNDNEKTLSALAALVVIVGVVLSPFGAGIRRLLSGRSASRKN